MEDNQIIAQLYRVVLKHVVLLKISGITHSFQ